MPSTLKASKMLFHADRPQHGPPKARRRRWAAMLVLWCLGAFLAAGPAAAGPVLLGAHVGTESRQSRRADFLALETALGRTLAIDSDYNDWSAFPNSPRVIWDAQHGRRTMLSWRVVFRSNVRPLRCATAVDIVDGVYDVQLARKAALVKALGVPILVRFNYEMTNNEENTCFTGFPVAQNLPLAGARFVAAWNHIVGLFRIQGVTNVEWVFAPSADAYEKGHWRYFYPGAANVDWLAADQYNKSDTPESFATDPGIQAFYRVAAPLGKPLMISETGANEDPSLSPDAQTRWLNTAHVYFKRHPALARARLLGQSWPILPRAPRLWRHGLCAFRGRARCFQGHRERPLFLTRDAAAGSAGIGAASIRLSGSRDGAPRRGSQKRNLRGR